MWNTLLSIHNICLHNFLKRIHTTFRLVLHTNLILSCVLKHPNELEIDDSLSADFIPRIGSSLHSVTNWRGRRTLPKADETKIRTLLSRAHANGRTIRFWAGTNRPKVWTKLLDLGVDWINVDRLKKFQRFMKKRQERIAALKD